MNVLEAAVSEIRGFGATNEEINGPYDIQGVDEAVGKVVEELQSGGDITIGRIKRATNQAIRENVKPKPRTGGGQKPKTEGSIAKSIINTYNKQTGIVGKLPIEMLGMEEEEQAKWKIGYICQNLYSRVACGATTHADFFAVSEQRKVGHSNVDKGMLAAKHYGLFDTIIMRCAIAAPQVLGENNVVVTPAETVATANYGVKMQAVVRNGDFDFTHAGKTLFKNMSISSFREVRVDGGDYAYVLKLEKPIRMHPQLEFEIQATFAGTTLPNTCIAFELHGLETTESAQALK